MTVSPWSREDGHGEQLLSRPAARGNDAKSKALGPCDPNRLKHYSPPKAPK